MWRGLRTLIARAARGPCRWDDRDKGCVWGCFGNVRGCFGPNPLSGAWGLGCRPQSHLSSPPKPRSIHPAAAEPTSRSFGLEVFNRVILWPQAFQSPSPNRRDWLHLGHFLTFEPWIHPPTLKQSL